MRELWHERHQLLISFRAICFDHHEAGSNDPSEIERAVFACPPTELLEARWIVLEIRVALDEWALAGR